MSNHVGVFLYLASFLVLGLAAVQLRAVGWLGPWFLIVVMTVGVLFSRFVARTWPLRRLAESPGETLRHVPFVVICTGANTLVARPLMFMMAWWVADLIPGSPGVVINSLPLWVVAPACLVVYEGMGYVQHRITHRVEALWRLFHCAHHEPTRFGTSLALRLHYFEYFLFQLTRLLLLHALQVDPATILLVISFSVWAGVLLHTDTGLKFGWVNQVITTPETHIWHHDADRQVNFSFGLLVVFDQLAGTFCHRPGDLPHTIGVRGWRPRRLLDVLLCRPGQSSRAAPLPGLGD